MLRTRASVFLVCAFAVQDQPRQVFRSGVDLVTVDVVVVDRDRKPITDLKASDFVVTAGRQTRVVKSAEFIPVTSPRITAAAANPDPVESATSNTGHQEGRSFLFVVDVGQIEAGQGRGAMRAVSEFIATLGPRDRVGVVALPAGRPRVDLTTNRALVRDALGAIAGTSQSRRDPRAAIGEDMTAGEAVYIDQGDSSVADSWRTRHGLSPCRPGDGVCLQDAQRVAGPYVAAERQHSRDLVDALRSLVGAMKPLPGVKTIVLVSEGMVSDREVSAELRRFSEAAAAARVTLYALALDVPLMQSSDERARASRQAGAFAPSQAPDRTLDNRFRLDGMADVSRAAGGDVFMISGTPTSALNQIDIELAGYYLLSFESDPSDDGGKRRTIDIKVRRPQALVRARTDFAIPAVPAPVARPTAASDLRASIGELLRWPVPVGDVPIDFATFSSPAVPGVTERRVALLAQLPENASVAAVGFEIVDDTGKVVSDSFEPNPSVPASGGRPTYLAAVLLGPGHYTVKFGVVASDGRRGSIEHSLWVRASPLAPLRLGDVLIGAEGREGFAPVARVPDGAGHISVRVEVQATDAMAFENASVLLEVIRQGDDRALTSASMAMAGTTNPTKRIANASLAVGRLSAGEYILRCTLQRGGESSERVARLISKR